MNTYSRQLKDEVILVHHKTTFQMIGQEKQSQQLMWESLHFTSQVPLSWKYSNYNSDFRSTSPFASMLLPALDTHSIAIIFQSLPSSLGSIVMVWEQKKEKNKLDIIARLGVICYDRNDSANIQFLNDMKRITEHEQQHGE